MKNKCSILVNSCDSYEDILDTFFELLHRFWPDLNFPIYLSTESLKYTNEYFDIINVHPLNKNCAWTTRIAECLNMIDTDYVLLILDDFFLYDYVDSQAFEKCLNWMDSNSKIATFIFYPICGKSKECNYDNFKQILKDSIYIICPAILSLWRKKSLLKYTEKYKEDIWLWEKNATNRSKTIYKKDEIYATKFLNKNVFPYDFTKYGLFSGKWQKETVNLFEKLGIKAINFKKRGFYDESIRSLYGSIKASFHFESAVICNYDLNHKGSSYIRNHNKRNNNKIKQIYDIRGSKNILRWEPAQQWGFGLKNLKIVVLYEDNKIENIDIDTLFGTFTKYKNLLVFNNYLPYVYIPTQKDKKMKKIKICCNLIFPLSEFVLKKCYMKSTEARSIEYDSLVDKLWDEFLITDEKTYHIVANPKLICIDKDGKKSEADLFVEYNRNKFRHTFIINSNYISAIYSYADDIGFALKNFNIKFLMNNGKKYKVSKNDLKNTKQLKNTYYFISQTQVNFNLINGVKKVIIEGEFIRPISNKKLKKIKYERNK